MLLFLHHLRLRFTGLAAAGCTFGCTSNACFHRASQYLLLMFDTGVFGRQNRDEALASQYFAYLDMWWGSQIVLHVLELAFITQAELLVY
jgi:hypothetical protein